MRTKTLFLNIQYIHCICIDIFLAFLWLLIGQDYRDDRKMGLARARPLYTGLVLYQLSNWGANIVSELH